MPQFDPTYFVSQIFWLIVCFALLVAVISGVVVPRIQHGINSRSRYLQDIKDKEAAYLQSIDDLTKHMNHLRYEHDDKCRRMLDVAHHAFIAEKENELHQLHDRFVQQRQEIYMTMAEDRAAMREKIPEIARNLAQDLMRQLTEKTSLIESKKRHAVH
ncbi:MAG: hypothetical protein K2X98_00355 [Alphaproteobacteria bacterium]|nr:hypothetical protein [Alphaproteobacteria bacterium]